MREPIFKIERSPIRGPGGTLTHRAAVAALADSSPGLPECDCDGEMVGAAEYCRPSGPLPAMEVRCTRCDLRYVVVLDLASLVRGHPEFKCLCVEGPGGLASIWEHPDYAPYLGEEARN